MEDKDKYSKGSDKTNTKNNSRSKRPRSDNDDIDEDDRGKKRFTERESTERHDATMDNSGAAASAGNDAAATQAPTCDEDIRQQPRRFGIEIGGEWSNGIDNRRELADAIDAIKPGEAQVREILKTNAGKILVFPESTKDYNILLKKEKWKRTDLTVTPAPKSTSKNAVIILNVDKTCSSDYVLGELRKKGFNPTGCARMRRTQDGTFTTSVKAFMNSEAEMEKLMTEGIFMYRSFHKVKRYITSKTRMCYKCQELNHLQKDCKNQRRCLKCSGNHHHSDCLATPDQYVCVNCSGNHASNDARCEKQKEAKQREEAEERASTDSILPTSSSTGFVRVESAMHQTTTTASSSGQGSSYANALAQPLISGPPPADLSSSIRDAVREAVAEAFATSARTLASEISKAFAAEMRREFDGLKVLIERYVASRNRGRESDDEEEDDEERDDYETGVEEDSDEDDDMSFSEDGSKNGTNGNFDPNQSSTPNPLGRRTRKGQSASQAHRQLAPSELTMEASATAYTVSLPPAMFKIPKDKNETEIAKILQDEISSRAKILRKDIQEIQFKILSNMDEKMNTSSRSLPAPTVTKRKPGRPRKNADETQTSLASSSATSALPTAGMKKIKPSRKSKAGNPVDMKNGS